MQTSDTIAPSMTPARQPPRRGTSERSAPISRTTTSTAQGRHRPLASDAATAAEANAEVRVRLAQAEKRRHCRDRRSRSGGGSSGISPRSEPRGRKVEERSRSPLRHGQHRCPGTGRRSRAPRHRRNRYRANPGTGPHSRAPRLRRNHDPGHSRGNNHLNNRYRGPTEVREKSGPGCCRRPWPLP